MTQPAIPICPRCTGALPSPDALVCATCGTLVHGQALSQLAAEAKWQTQYNPGKAIALWEECLKRLPPQSRQYASVQSEIEQLRAMPPMTVTVEEPGSVPLKPQETLPVAVLKTGGSMLLSILVYQFSFGWIGALGFVLLILVHELGHVVANIKYGFVPVHPFLFPMSAR